MTANTSHPAFTQVPSFSQIIWRYMDLAKFMSLLETKSLFFSRQDCLGDPFEGTITENLQKTIKDVSFQFQISGDYGNGINSFQEDFISWSRRLRLCRFINCWHMNTFESAAMWKLYSFHDQGISIKSTYGQLIECLDTECLVGAVTYIDYDCDSFPLDNDLYQATHKRKSFEHEREVRAVIEDLGRGPLSQNWKKGISKNVVLNDLIDSVYVNPLSSEWYYNLIKNICTRYGLTRPVVYSNLVRHPVF